MAQISRMRARGAWKNLIVFLLLFGAGYVGYVLLTPRLTAYEAKAAVRAACNEHMRLHFWQSGPDGRRRWEEDFLSRMRRLGIQLEPDQYQFENSNPCTKSNCSCKGVVAFALETPWPWLQDYVEQVKPYRSIHRIEVEVPYRSDWH